jgi:menaquinone-9 beta-reductase
MSAYDAAVIGGGLAGCSAAIHLARQGFSVGLFESGQMPQHKVCGEFMSPGCVPLLDSLGVLDRLYECGAVDLDTIVLTVPNGSRKPLIWSTPAPGKAIGVSRYLLDSVLIDRAAALGVTVHQNTTVTDVSGALDRGFQLSARNGHGPEAYSARAVIGAFGKRSALDRVMARPFLNRSHPFVGLKNHFTGVSLPDRIELHTFPGGYCGMSEVEGGLLNVCLLVRQEVFRQHGPDIERFIAWMLTQNPQLQQRLERAQPVHDSWLSIAQVPFSSKSSIEDDVLMAGDAAGMIVPLTGDGMEMALQGGQIAAAHITAYLKGELSPEVLRRAYPQAWQAEFRRRLWLGRLLQLVMLRPPLLRPGLRVVQGMPALGRYLVKKTRNTAYTVNRIGK